jgi:hypothetical protein
MAYIKSLYLIKNRELFDLESIDMDKFAAYGAYYTQLTLLFANEKKK